MEQISPELALVDPELAATARALLPAPRDCLGSRPRPAYRPEPEPISSKPRRGSPRRPSLIVALAALLIAAIVGLPSLDLLGTGTGVEPTLAPVPPTPGAPLRELRWRRVPGADFYNVVLWSNGRRVADLWPRTNHVQPRGASVLGPGRYFWFAFPGFSDGGKTRYGALVGRGSFQIKGSPPPQNRSSSSMT